MRLDKSRIRTHFPEFRIDDEAINAVAKKLGCDKKLVEEIHNFQWKTVLEGTVNNKSVYLYKFFMLKTNSKKVFTKIRYWLNEKQKIEGYLIKVQKLGSTKEIERAQKKLVDIEEKLSFYNSKLI